MGRERIARGHVKGALARDAGGAACDPRDDGAASWCAVGAIQSRPRDGFRTALDALWGALPAGSPDAAERSPEASVSAFNDAGDTRPADVLALFDRAIAATEGP